MNAQIDVIDNFFNEELHDEIYYKIRDSKWSFNGGSLKNPIWHADNLEQDKFFSNYIQELIKDRFNLIIFTTSFTKGDFNFFKVFK